MPSINLGLVASGLGGSISLTTTRTADGGSSREITVPVGQAGTLTTRTSDTAGTLTLGASHGIITGQIIDLYWSGGERFAVTVGTVAGTSVPFSLGSGTVLPIATTAIVASARTEVVCDIDGDNLEALVCQQAYSSQTVTSESRVLFEDAAGDDIAALTLEANVPRVYDIDGGDANPFAGDPITKFFVSNGSSTDAATFKLVWLQDSTP